MKKFFIVCEIRYSKKTEYVPLQSYYDKYEGSIWFGDCIEVAKDINSAASEIIDLCQKFQWESPHLFDTLESAKEAVEIIKAHDDPNDHREFDYREFKYHIVGCVIALIPTIFCDVQ